jgi:hypothetical protein
MEVLPCSGIQLVHSNLSHLRRVQGNAWPLLLPGGNSRPSCVAERGAKRWYLQLGRRPKMSPHSSAHHRAVNMPSLGCGESRVVTSWREGKRLHSLWVCLPLGREGCSQELARHKRVTRFAGALAQGLKGIASRYWTVIDGHETPLFKNFRFFGLHRSDPEASFVDLWSCKLSSLFSESFAQGKKLEATHFHCPRDFQAGGMHCGEDFNVPGSTIGITETFNAQNGRGNPRIGTCKCSTWFTKLKILKTSTWTRKELNVPESCRHERRDFECAGKRADNWGIK